MSAPWSQAVQGGAIQDGEDAADIVAAGGVAPPNAVPGSRLSVLFNPGPVQSVLFEYLQRDDILNVAQADPYARRKILCSINPYNQFGKAKDYNWRGVNLDNDGPHPYHGLCDAEKFPPIGELRKSTMHHFVPTDSQARRHRACREAHNWQDHSTSYDTSSSTNNSSHHEISDSSSSPSDSFLALTITIPSSQSSQIPPGSSSTSITDVGRWDPRYYNPDDWFKCRRRANHLDNKTAHCTECNKGSFVKVFDWHFTLGKYLLTCGLCHRQATQKFPNGHCPAPIAAPYADAELPNCECMEDLRYQTCYPCVDRLLDRQINNSDRDKWPEYFNPWDPDNIDPKSSPARVPGGTEGYSLRPVRSSRGVNKIKWPICPCGREVNPIQHPTMYPDWAFIDGEIDFSILKDDGRWTVVCVDCDGLWVPNSEGGPIPVDAVQPRVPFKEALGLGGKGKNHWTRQPKVTLPPGVINGELEWVVKEILDSRYHYRRLQYRVSWQGLPGVDTVWYPRENFKNAGEKVRKFHQRNPRSPGPKDQRGRRKK